MSEKTFSTIIIVTDTGVKYFGIFQWYNVHKMIININKIIPYKFSQISCSFSKNRETIKWFSFDEIIISLSSTESYFPYEKETINCENIIEIS